MARDVLNEPRGAARWSSAWRGIRFLVTQCPKAAKMEVILLETDAGARGRGSSRAATGAMTSMSPSASSCRSEFDSIEPALRRSRIFAEQRADPGRGRAWLSKRCSAQDHPQGLPGRVRLARERAQRGPAGLGARRGTGSGWSEPTRWLCAVANRVALHGGGLGRRRARIVLRLRRLGRRNAARGQLRQRAGGFAQHLRQDMAR